MYHPTALFIIHYLPFVLAPWQWSSSSSSSSSWNLSSIFLSSSILKIKTNTTVNRYTKHEYDDHQYSNDQITESYIRNKSHNSTKKNQNSNIAPWLFDRSILSSSSTTTASSSQLPIPVVGILAQPYYHNNTTNTMNDSGQYQYIAASYVKWIESGGGRSIPIPYDMTSDVILDEIFLQINGILLPGGNNSTIPYSVRYLLNRSIESNANGNYFPIWGTCLGFEMILQYIGGGGVPQQQQQQQPSESASVLQNDFNATNITLPLILLNNNNNNNHDTMNRNNRNNNEYPVVLRRNSMTPSYLRSITSTTATTKTTTTTTTIMQKSILYAPRNIHDSVTKYAITMNNHHQGIEPSHFQQNPYLTQYFSITSINYDMNFRPFVSTIEPNHPYQYPIYGVQYHPEKNAFEYATYPNTTIPYEVIDHSPMGIELSFYLAEFFMNCVRFGQYNNNDDDDDRSDWHEYTDAVKFPTIITYPIISGGLSFEQIYLLPNASHWEK